MAPIPPPALPSAPLNARIKADLVGAKPTWQAASHIVVRNNFNAQSHPERDPLASVRDVSVQVSHPAGTFSCTIYTPEVSLAGPLPVLVYFHGGGFVIGNPASHKAQAVWCATGASCIVVSVDYRLAPEFPYPTPVHDSVEAVEWVFNNAKELNINPKRITVGGDSAGGNLTTVVALELGGRKDSKTIICQQLLVYPVTDLLRLYPDSYDSYIRYGTGLGLETKSMIWLIDHYLDGLGEKLTPAEFQSRAAEMTASPIVATSEELSLGHRS
ncbi:hypothetical protein M427DRAFT_32968 [Gonapodya prolifera JEL478]|uniref:Alpha/beta hydrolase fold-3 domain-containing protein n=1 Tax=Gonapodya prolifera (strain JEL478) TaxID=1344416 RepID=A0A139AE98_GONPJ|nr:hypothetical protein M427DRAFT_32968 [Gonapodya prolifera JEL478]|eukprot:KXS14765.1 hypothetical protein M427DRAFT_32968 [Gonapodya prolifera JEL478]